MSNIIKNTFINVDNNCMFLNTDKLLNIEIISDMENSTDDTSMDKNEELKEENLDEQIDIHSIHKVIRQREKALEFKEENMRKKANEMIKDAGETAENIILAAKKQVDVIEKRAMRDGQEKGYKEGFDKANKEIEELKKSIKKEYEEKEYDLQMKEERFEKDFIECAVSILEKITGIIIDDKKEVIFHIINREFNDMEKSDNYLIRVSKEDFELVNSKKQILQSYIKDESTIEIIETDTLEKNRCIIETDTSVIDCSLDTQMENLITDLKMLSKL